MAADFVELTEEGLATTERLIIDAANASTTSLEGVVKAQRLAANNWLDAEEVLVKKTASEKAAASLVNFLKVVATFDCCELSHGSCNIIHEHTGAFRSCQKRPS